MQSRFLARRSAEAFCLLVVTLVFGCQTTPPGPSSGSWAQEASDVARQRLAARANPFSPHGGEGRGRGAESSPRRERAFAAAPDVSREAGGRAAREEDRFLLAASAADPAAEDAATSQVETTSRPAGTQPAVERGPLPGFGDTVVRDVKRMPAELWRDTRRVYTNVPNLIILGLSGAASIALRPEADEDVADYYGNGKTFNGDWPDTFATLGNPGIHFAVAGVMYLAGQQLPHTKTYEVGRSLFSALIINDVSTVLLKLAVCDRSPNGEHWAWPSGHVSSTMTLAAVMDEAYGPLVGVPLYGLTTLVAIERMDDGEHWLSDVIFGAAMGWVIGHTVAGGRAPEIFGGEVVPWANPNTGGAGVAWLKSFK